MDFVNDGTQNVLTPLPCPFCGGQPIIREPQSQVLQLIAEIVCSRVGHAAAAYGKTVQEAVTIWNRRNGGTADLPSREAEYQAAWNDNCGPLPRVTKLVGDRLQKLRRRIKEGLTLEDFRSAVWACSHTPFLLGLVGDPDKRSPKTFDWLVSTSGIIPKVLDGTYGAVGKTEAELRAEAQAREKEQQNQSQREYDVFMRRRYEKMLLGQSYGAAVDAQIRDWAARQDDPPQSASDELLSHISGQLKMGIKYPASVVTKVREWEERQAVSIKETATSD